MQGTLEKAKRISEEKKTKKKNNEDTREHQLVSSLKIQESVRKKISPKNPKWVSPKRIAIRSIRPLPPHLRSLNVHVPSSIKTYTNSTYFPETDTHYVPEGKGGAFEILAAGAESLKWLKPYPEQYWASRSSTLKELKQTGRLHWRETERRGEKSRSKEDARPGWDPERKKWDRSMMSL